MSKQNHPQDNLVHLTIRCTGCDTLLMEACCDPDTDTTGIMTCPGCQESVLFDFTDMMAMGENNDLPGTD